jgi:hypothetical protein
MKLKEHKVKFLEDCGFVQTYKDEPSISKFDNKMHNMEKWTLIEPFNIYHLYIHFEEVEPSYCNLYYGNNDPSAEFFSERNLISEMRKRGFKERVEVNE